MSCNTYTKIQIINNVHIRENKLIHIHNNTVLLNNVVFSMELVQSKFFLVRLVLLEVRSLFYFVSLLNDSCYCFCFLCYIIIVGTIMYFKILALIEK